MTAVGDGVGWGGGGHHSDTRKELVFQNSHKTMLNRIIFLWTSSIPDCRKFEKWQSLSSDIVMSWSK
jgi:hypothetical protein